MEGECSHLRLKWAPPDGTYPPSALRLIWSGIGELSNWR